MRIEIVSLIADLARHDKAHFSDEQLHAVASEMEGRLEAVEKRYAREIDQAADDKVGQICRYVKGPLDNVDVGDAIWQAHRAGLIKD